MGTAHPADKGVKAYARRLEVSPKAVRKGIAEGRIPVDGNGRIVTEAADAALAQGTVSGPKVSRTLALARRRKLAAACRLLGDELAILRANTVTAVDLRASWLAACREAAAEVERTFAAEVPCGNAAAAFAVLRDLIDDLLARLSDPPEPPKEEETEPKRLDLSSMSSVALATLKADRQAERLELGRSLRRGELLALDRIALEIEDRIGRCRSLLLGIPSRGASFFELGEASGRQALAHDMVHALAELAGHGVVAADYIPADLTRAGRPANSPGRGAARRARSSGTTPIE